MVHLNTRQTKITPVATNSAIERSMARYSNIAIVTISVSTTDSLSVTETDEEHEHPAPGNLQRFGGMWSPSIGNDGIRSLGSVDHDDEQEQLGFVYGDHAYIALGVLIRILVEAEDGRNIVLTNTATIASDNVNLISDWRTFTLTLRSPPVTLASASSGRTWFPISSKASTPATTSDRLGDDEQSNGLLSPIDRTDTALIVGGHTLRLRRVHLNNA